MSFTDEVKNEVARQDFGAECCRVVELAALVKNNGSLRIDNQQLALNLKSKNAAVARRIYRLLQEQFDFFTHIIVRKKMYLDKKNYYIIRVPPQPGVREVLIECGLITDEYQLNHQIKEELIANKCCTRSYLRGVFLAVGSVSNPDSEYHLEVTVSSEKYAIQLQKLCMKFKIDLKRRQKNGGYLLYLKKADDIIKVMNLIGSDWAVLQFENARVYKEVRNRVNRIVNCETANLNKTVVAAQRHLEDIELIDSLQGLDKLPTSLQEIAELRRKNPYSSLKELGELLEPTLSKSGVNHRLRRIKKIADKLKGK
ncbi:DNA-binding protein WhiA [Natroniella sulfidigena]|uniref:DNA-binding protein WhiA n=1 Tax=Natroniella sulfidigena TaxID=723921 RepID=UPI00200ADF29|nr:DNA-binding protein WhiA [Natroniella sulfidigena]MCK8817189.1 DNA-binding protein WhiA [Natroniella sulfidigena]